MRKYCFKLIKSVGVTVLTFCSCRRGRGQVFLIYWKELARQTVKRRKINTFFKRVGVEYL